MPQKYKCLHGGCGWEGTLADMEFFPDSNDGGHYYCPECKFHFFSPCLHRVYHGRCSICNELLPDDWPPDTP